MVNNINNKIKTIEVKKKKENKKIKKQSTVSDLVKQYEKKIKTKSKQDK